MNPSKKKSQIINGMKIASQLENVEEVRKEWEGKRDKPQKKNEKTLDVDIKMNGRQYRFYFESRKLHENSKAREILHDSVRLSIDLFIGALVRAENQLKEEFNCFEITNDVEGGDKL